MKRLNVKKEEMRVRGGRATGGSSRQPRSLMAEPAAAAAATASSRTEAAAARRRRRPPRLRRPRQTPGREKEDEPLFRGRFIGLACHLTNCQSSSLQYRHMACCLHASCNFTLPLFFQD